MFEFSNLPSSPQALFQAYASTAAFMMMVRSMMNEFLPSDIKSYLIAIFEYFFGPLIKRKKDLTLIIDEKSGMTGNLVYEAAELYLRTKVSPSTEKLRVGRNQRQANYTVTIEKGEEVSDKYEGVYLKWRYASETNENTKDEKRFFELSFDKKYKDMVLSSYLPYVEEKAKEIKAKTKAVRLYSRDCNADDADYAVTGGQWGSIKLDHPSNFDTLALDPDTKKMIINDLDRFLQRKDFYKKVGKAWKRGYLLYGPPGTGKSSLIAAMANYLQFDIFDLELSSLYSNSDFRRVMLATTNRSILVIEDIDCNKEMLDRETLGVHGYTSSDSRLTLSGILNFIDGLWSSIGDERILVFTTNHKDRLDPALLRPGRMDVHIHLSYCTVYGFRHLASRYHDIDSNHPLYPEIEEMIQISNVTPAEVAEELMRSDNADVALQGLLQALKRKKSEAEEKARKEAEEKAENEEEKGNKEQSQGDKSSENDSDGKKKTVKNRKNKGEKAKGKNHKQTTDGEVYSS